VFPQGLQECKTVVEKSKSAHCVIGSTSLTNSSTKHM